ncbi:RNA polymerase sigma factor [Actinomadura roseirufa]|uniref:RNA polymerase sigma factor n=1 Tax=Actinomadura roseirufa TaxID=2094049 RepID=UPI001F5EEACA|nr:sigma-70 family RNA polymerase sigma factor [Actinomadura roseirufa]
MSTTPGVSPPPDERRHRFEQVYEEHRAKILGYALRRTADPQDAADVLAETFLIAWRKLDDVPRGDEAKPWLYGVARRVLANHHRGGRRRSALVEDLAGQLRTDLGTHVAFRPEEDRAAIAAAFGKLPANDRELLSLVGWEGLDHGEIAAVLGCSRNAVRIRLYRARRRFARELDRQGGDPQAGRAPHAQALSAATLNGERA